MKGQPDGQPAARWMGSPAASSVVRNTEPLIDAVQYSVLRSAPPKATLVPRYTTRLDEIVTVRA